MLLIRVKCHRSTELNFSHENLNKNYLIHTRVNYGDEKLFSPQNKTMHNSR